MTDTRLASYACTASLILIIDVHEYCKDTCCGHDDVAVEHEARPAARFVQPDIFDLPHLHTMAQVLANVTRRATGTVIRLR